MLEENKKRIEAILGRRPADGELVEDVLVEAIWTVYVFGSSKE